MRKFKFRAWYKAEQKFLYGFENIYDHDFVINFNGEVGTCDEDGFFMSFKDIELMEFTGLIDRNQKYIYEGDILKREIYKGHPEYYLVVFDKGGFKRKALDKKIFEANGLLDFVEQHCNKFYEVVGNIFQNSEFLEKLK